MKKTEEEEEVEERTNRKFGRRSRAVHQEASDGTVFEATPFQLS